MRDTILITDIGSTTTKAILLRQDNSVWHLEALSNAPTTVEKPYEDVMTGIIMAVEELQKHTDVKLLVANTPHQVKASNTPSEQYQSSAPLPGQAALPAGNQTLKINPELSWLSTSSAGGGLQILVIGLTRAESAASAERAAYGVGGIILDTIAIDDGRSTVEQMQAIESRQPDIILFSGGYEGGAYASILRLAETLSYCQIKPKYSLKAQIPVVYAGNSDAAIAIKHILKDGFDLHILPNLRPDEALENLSPVTEEIHELFLNKVMQQAPGYKSVSDSVSDPVIPTPMGVMNALQIISETKNASADPLQQAVVAKNILAVDIGGATTDVYSNLFGKFYRTVSANYGMSYNLCNVFANAGKWVPTSIETNNTGNGKKREQPARYQAWLHPGLTEEVMRDYLGNKMLNPTCNPTDEIALHIEQAMAKVALQLSLQQHLAMNFSVHEIGHFLRMKNDDLDPFHEQFYRDKLDESLHFGLQDFHQIIGAGGVISHAPQPRQAAMMLIDGLQPRGITEIWRDKHFISPHLGKLRQVDKPAAQSLLQSDCLEALCVCIRPLAGKMHKEKPALTLEIQTGNAHQTRIINGNSLVWIELSGKSELKIKTQGSAQLAPDIKEMSYTTSLPLLIDTRIQGEFSFAELNAALQLYTIPGDKNFSIAPISFPALTMESKKGMLRRTLSLPYAGKIYVSEGEKVQPDTILGENLYDPPRLYVLQVFRGNEKEFTEEHFRKYLLVKAGEEVKLDQLIYNTDMSLLASLMSTGVNQYYSPVRGKVERIDWANGTLLLREIQDYTFEPVKINLAEKLGIKPSLVLGQMRKRIGDFVHAGEILAGKGKTKLDNTVIAPTTGTIQSYDSHTGIIIIKYIKKDLSLRACLQGSVTAIAQNRYVELEYEGTNLTGSIGFGKMTDGKLVYADTWNEGSIEDDAIMAYPFAVNMEQINILKQHRIRGLIVPSLAQKDLVNLLGYEIGVGITGNESIPFAVLLFSGFGEMSLPASIQSELKTHSGKHTVLVPDTQIRAGVVRPVLVIQ